MESANLNKPIILPIVLRPSNLRPIAYRTLTKKFGLNIQSDALEKLSSYIGRNFGNQWRGPLTVSFLERVGKLWKDQNRGLFLNGDGVEVIIKEIDSEQNAKELKSRDPSFGNSGQLPGNTRKSFKVFSDFMQSTQDTQPASSLSSQDRVDQELEMLDESINWTDFFKVVDISRFQRIRFDERRRQLYFLPVQNSQDDSISLPTSKDSISFYVDRFHILKDRLLRNDHFQPRTFSSMNSITGSFHPQMANQQITSIKNLLGRHGEHFVLFGILTLSSAGLWQLQDDTDTIILELSQCIFPTNCFVTSGNYVICDGIYSNSGKFYVSALASPPSEPQEVSIDSLGNIDFNGIYSKHGHIDTGLKKRLPMIEREFPEHKIIFLGCDIFLNNLKVLEALKKLFTTLTNEIDEQNVNVISIVFPGSFIDSPLDVSESSSFSYITSSGLYKSYFDSFASILQGFPKLCGKVQFTILPGDNDPWSSLVTKGSNSIWPKFKVPAMFGRRLKRWVKDVDWASNPCKMNYLSHDITIVRDDVGSRLRRNDITYLSKDRLNDIKKEELEKKVDSTVEKGDDLLLEIDRVTKPKLKPDEIQSRKVVKTLLDQGSLSPFSSRIRPILSNYAQILSLIPLPDLLVICDPTTPIFDLIYKNSHVINPGKFIQDGKVSFFEYRPATRKSKFRQLL